MAYFKYNLLTEVQKVAAGERTTVGADLLLSDIAAQWLEAVEPADVAELERMLGLEDPRG